MCRKFHILAISLGFPWDLSQQVREIPCLNKSIDFQWDLFREMHFLLEIISFLYFFTGSLFLLQAYNFNGQLFSLSPFGGIGGPERTVIFVCFGGSSSLARDSSGQLDIFWHDGDSLGMYGTSVGIFK